MAKRIWREQKTRRNPRNQLIELVACERDLLRFVNNWVWTYDPRLAVSGELPAKVPFELFPRQQEMLQFVLQRIEHGNDGLIEKSRDVGATWCLVTLAIWKWLFHPGFKTTFGSRKVEYVDRLGDPDSIFEKMRMLLRELPKWMLPKDFSWREHSNHMLLLNPVNGNTIRGEGGDSAPDTSDAVSVEDAYEAYDLEMNAKYLKGK